MNNVNDILAMAIVFGSLATVIIVFLKTLTTYYLRKKMVEKGYVDKESIGILTARDKADSKLATLKWGLIIFFAGLSLVIVDIIDADPESALPYGIFILGISFGMLLHYFLAGKAESK